MPSHPSYPFSHSFLVVSLAIRLRGVITLVHDQICRPVVLPSTEVLLQDGLRTSSVPRLRIDRGTGHVRDHGVPAAPWVLCVAERVVLGCWLREPDVTTVATEVAGFQGSRNILLDDDGTTGGVDEPRA